MESGTSGNIMIIDVIEVAGSFFYLALDHLSFPQSSAIKQKLVTM